MVITYVKYMKVATGMLGAIVGFNGDPKKQ